MRKAAILSFPTLSFLILLELLTSPHRGRWCRPPGRWRRHGGQSPGPVFMNELHLTKASPAPDQLGTLFVEGVIPQQLVHSLISFASS